MFIAFEGPDNTGKSTSAASLTSFDSPIYNATKANHAGAIQAMGGDLGLVQTFDRIDWFSHMVYRLALPDREWNDERPRTVFSMPDTHLVVKMHHPQLAEFTADEVVDTPIGKVNPMYYYFADFFMGLNKERGYDMFKSISIMEVMNNPNGGTFSQRLKAFDSPVLEWSDVAHLEVDSDESLLKLLRDVDRQCI